MELWDFPQLTPYRLELSVLLVNLDLPRKRWVHTEHLILSNYVARHYGSREIPQAQSFIGERL